MATFLHGKNTRVIFSNPVANASYDISQFFNSADVSTTVEPTETTAFLNGGAKTYIAGIKDGQISLSGMYEGSSTGIDAIINTAIANSADEAVIVFPDSATATSTSSIDAHCYMARGIETKYDLKSPVTGVVATDMTIQADGGVWAGRGQYIPNTVASGVGTFTTPARQHLSATTNGGLLVMGVLSLTGTTPTVSLSFQHSQDGVTWVSPTGGTLATESGVGTTVSNLTGTIYQYTRLSYTLGGTSPTAIIYFGLARY